MACAPTELARSQDAGLSVGVSLRGGWAENGRMFARDPPICERAEPPVLLQQLSESSVSDFGRDCD